MSQSKGIGPNSIKSMYFSLVLLYITATKGRLNIYNWAGKAAPLLCLFHLKSSQFKKWLQDGRSLKKRLKEERINPVILMDNAKPNNLQADSSAKYYLCA